MIPIREIAFISSFVLLPFLSAMGNGPDANHPLHPVLRLARSSHEQMQKDLQNYTCKLVIRERIGDLLEPERVAIAKVRHPKSEQGTTQSPIELYLRFDAPDNIAGREVLFRNVDDDVQLLVRKGGKTMPALTAKLTPNCPLAMRGNRYPITEFGIMRLCERMIEVGERELAFGECEVNTHDNLTFESRSCTQVEIVHPYRREHFKYHIARIMIDNSLQLPIQFEAFEWPTEENGDPVLIESYSYRELKINVPLSDSDFNRGNPEYSFASAR